MLCFVSRFMDNTTERCVTIRDLVLAVFVNSVSYSIFVNLSRLDPAG